MQFTKVRETHIWGTFKDILNEVMNAMSVNSHWNIDYFLQFFEDINTNHIIAIENKCNQSVLEAIQQIERQIIDFSNNDRN